MGGRKFKLYNPKKLEKKKCVVMSLPVSIKLTPDIKVFPISIPLKALEQDTDYTVKLPIQHFFFAPLLTTQALKLRLEKKTLPLLWSRHLGCQDSLLLCKMSLAEGIHVAPVVQVSLRINEDLSWSVSFLGRIIPPNAPSCRTSHQRSKPLMT